MKEIKKRDIEKIKFIDNKEKIIRIYFKDDTAIDFQML